MRWHPWVVRSLLAAGCAATLAGRGPIAPARAQAPAPAPERPATTSADAATAPDIEFSEVEIATASPIVPGAGLALDVQKDLVPGTRFRWSQVEGPSVAIADPTRPAIQITVPAGSPRLVFLLAAVRPELVKVVRVVVPVEGQHGADSPGGPAPAVRIWGGPPPPGPATVKADAGDDQVGLAGRRITLNGSQTAPAEGVGARWLQLSGPAIASAQVRGLFFSFVPTEPGIYRFALIAAFGGEMSEPDEVVVTVGSPPTLGANPPAPALAPAPNPVAEILAAGLIRVEDGPRIASEVADVIEAIADRATLYPSFDHLLSELSRRLDVVIPADPRQRTAWNQAVFAPLTAHTTAALLSADIDLRRAPGLGQTLSAPQKARVRDHYRQVARAFRDAASR